MLDGWVHVHLTMVIWFLISISNEVKGVMMMMMMMIFQSKRNIYNKEVIIYFTVQIRNMFGLVHSLKSHIGLKYISVSLSLSPITILLIQSYVPLH